MTELHVKNQGLGETVTLSVYTIDYASQGGTMLNYLFVVFKLASIEILRVANDRASRDLSFPSENYTVEPIVNTFNEIEFCGDGESEEGGGNNGEAAGGRCGSETEFVVSRVVQHYDAFQRSSSNFSRHSSPL